MWYGDGGTYYFFARMNTRQRRQDTSDVEAGLYGVKRAKTTPALPVTKDSTTHRHRLNASAPDLTAHSLYASPSELSPQPTAVLAASGVTISGRSKPPTLLGRKMSSLLNNRIPQLTAGGQVKAVFYSWTSVLFVFVPVGFAISYSRRDISPVAVFIINFLAIVPSNAALGFAIEEVNLYVGDILAGLISMSFSNVVQLITSILAQESAD